jgi:hypothetical protein
MPKNPAQKSTSKIKSDPLADETQGFYPPYVPIEKHRMAQIKVLKKLTDARIIIQRSYNQFNNRTLFDAIDDWTMRWNGYIPPVDLVSGNPTSNIFLNFTRNAIISYLAKVAMTLPEPKIIAVNKKTGIINKHLAEVFSDLNTYSLQQENGPARLLDIALETTVKGTGIVYEGYLKNEQKFKNVKGFDAVTGEVEYEEEERTIYDDCFQQVVPLEDFYIGNPYEPDVQKQPYIIWKKITTYDEAFGEFSHYKNWQYIKPGAYALTQEPTTFYRNKLYTELAANQVEILRYYCRKDNHNIITINGVVMYEGPIPFKDGKYPFAKYIFEPYELPFFWGAGAPQKIMGEQDVQNTLINMMLAKTYGSLLPYGLSSDLDDLIEDDTLAPNKIRKVGDITKWKFDTLPGVSPGEEQMFQTIMTQAQQNSGMVAGGNAYSPKGGKLTAKQLLLQQQDLMQKLTFNMNFLEDGERDRTELRLNHILQFYSIPRIEQTTGKKGKEIDAMIYRDIKLNDTDLRDGRSGTKIIKLVDGSMIKNDDRRKKIADDLSVLEEMGELSGTPTEAIAVPVSMFNDYNNQVQIVKNSSYERNQTLDQAMRQDYAQWRLSLAQLVPVNAKALIEWVNEAYEIPPDTFELGATQTQAQQQQQMGMASGGQPQPGQGNAGQIAQGNQPQKPQQSKMQAGPVKPQVKQAPGGLALMGM